MDRKSYILKKMCPLTDILIRHNSKLETNFNTPFMIRADHVESFRREARKWWRCGLNKCRVLLWITSTGLLLYF